MQQIFMRKGFDPAWSYILLHIGQQHRRHLSLYEKRQRPNNNVLLGLCHSHSMPHRVRQQGCQRVGRQVCMENSKAL